MPRLDQMSLICQQIQYQWKHSALKTQLNVNQTIYHQLFSSANVNKPGRWLANKLFFLFFWQTETIVHLSSIQSLDKLGHWRGRKGRFSRDPLPAFSAGGPCEQVWHGKRCPLFDVVHPAFPLLTTALATLQGALVRTGMSTLWCCPSSISSANHGISHPQRCPEQICQPLCFGHNLLFSSPLYYAITLMLRLLHQ